jgi:hypothetical protein
VTSARTDTLASVNDASGTAAKTITTAEDTRINSRSSTLFHDAQIVPESHRRGFELRRCAALGSFTDNGMQL